LTTLYEPHEVPRRPAELPFETIKARAQLAFAAALQAEGANPGFYLGKSNPSYNALVSFARMTAGEREIWRNFILTLPTPDRCDMTALKAHGNAEYGQHDWSLLLMQVRTAGLRRIDDWDIRCIDRLIDLFPNCVPRTWRKAKLTSYIEEHSGKWMVCAR